MFILGAVIADGDAHSLGPLEPVISKGWVGDYVGVGVGWFECVFVRITCQKHARPDLTSA